VGVKHSSTLSLTSAIDGGGWMVKATPRPLYPWERPGTHCNCRIKSIQCINLSKTQQLITQINLIATRFDSTESESGLPKNRSNVSNFIVHSGIPNAYNRLYSWYNRICARNLNIRVYTMEYILKSKLIKVIQEKQLCCVKVKYMTDLCLYLKNYLSEIK